MEAKMTLDECWENCEAMWKWIAEVWQPSDDIDDLKRKWLVEHGLSGIVGGCFFCEWNETVTLESCDGCPGKMVDPGFDCGNKQYHYVNRPVEFYNEIVRLNKIRLGQK